MTTSPAPLPTGSAAHRPSRLSEIQEEIRHARPGLPESGEEFRAAVLLLLLGETGLNVDRLALRTRFPREQVSRWVRRLADNALWLDGALNCTWTVHRARSEHFWWDVEVVLGRRLRRIDVDGAPEWAPLDGWVKEFEYAARNAGEKAVYNEYRFIPAHDPEPELHAPGDDEDEDEDEEADVTEPNVPERNRLEPEPAEAVVPRPAAEPPRLTVWPTTGAGWLSPPEPAAPAPPAESLVDGWAKADWLG